MSPVSINLIERERQSSEKEGSEGRRLSALDPVRVGRGHPSDSNTSPDTVFVVKRFESGVQSVVSRVCISTVKCHEESRDSRGRVLSPVRTFRVN